MLEFTFSNSSMYQNLALVDEFGTATCHGCRELFHTEFRKARYKAIFHTHGLPRTLALLKTVEDRLKLPQKDRVQLILTNQYGWYEIKSTWWLRQNLRFSLLTILLRASLYYDNINDAIESIPHLSQTSKAVEQFLSGMTEYKGTRVSGKVGWVRVLSNHYPSGKLSRQ